jgi:four helix bundle protein
VSATFEDLRVLKSAEEIADSIWKRVVEWDEFAQDVVGKQLARSADSIGANIAESYGHYNYGEKLQFLYYSRGSLFETKYWLNRAVVRELLKAEEAKDFAAQLSDVARQLNSFASSLKTQRKEMKTSSKAIAESNAEYVLENLSQDSISLFTDTEINWLDS